MVEDLPPTREAVAWNPGREAIHAEAGTGEQEVLTEPLLWGLFSLGGFITAFLFPVTLFLLFFAAPFRLWPTDPGAFVAFSMQYGQPIVRLFFFVLIGGSLFHGTHRLKFMLVDAGMRSRGAEAFLDLLLNGVAVLGTLGALYYMLKGWLI